MPFCSSSRALIGGQESSRPRPIAQPVALQHGRRLGRDCLFINVIPDSARLAEEALGHARPQEVEIDVQDDQGLLLETGAGRLERLEAIGSRGEWCVGCRVAGILPACCGR